MKRTLQACLLETVWRTKVKEQEREQQDLDAVFDRLDENGDGALDLVVAYKFIDAVLWYKNLGGAEEIQFGPPQDVCKSGTCKYACGVACADLNGDGRVDVCRLCGNKAVN